MTFSVNKIKITFDYFTAAFICIVIIAANDGRYITALICTAIHECSHLAAMKFYSRDEICVTVNLFNISIKDSMRLSRPYRQDAVIICAGPAANLLTAAAAFPFYIFFSSTLACNIMMISLALAIFNIMPLESTDGGQLLCLVLKRRFSEQTSELIVTVITVIFLLPTATLGFIILLQSKYNYTLLFASLYLSALLLTKCGKTSFSTKTAEKF